MSLTVERFGLDIIAKICMEMDQPSLLRFGATCKAFHELIFSSPNPGITTSDTKFEAMQKIEKRNRRAAKTEQIWNHCFQKNYQKTMDQLVICLPTTEYERCLTQNLLIEVKKQNSGTKMRKNLNIGIIIQPINIYEKIQACFFKLKLDALSDNLAKEFESFVKNDPLYPRLKFFIPPRCILDKVSLILFQKDYEIFLQTKKEQCLIRWLIRPLEWLC